MVLVRLGSIIEERNKHHREAWTDYYDKGNRLCSLCPYKYAAEMLCDYLGAGKAYQARIYL